jgi:hypothetical protein
MANDIDVLDVRGGKDSGAGPDVYALRAPTPPFEFNGTQSCG